VKATNRRLILLALLVAVVAGYGVFVFFSHLQEMANQEHTDEVVVALRNIPARSLITADMVAAQRVPKGQRHAQAFVGLNDVLGKVTTQSIIAGEQVLSSRLYATGSQSGLAYQLENGQRAVSIAISELNAVAKLVRPGDRVDIVLSSKWPSDDKTDRSVIMLQNIKVLAVGSEMRNGSPAPAEASTLTLAVTPGDAEKVIWAQNYGDINLILRPATDHNIVPTPGQRNATVAGGK
jgi:pilus assembly protein CpaB